MPLLHGSGQIFEGTKTCTDPSLFYTVPAIVQVEQQTVLQSVTEFARFREKRVPQL